MAQTNKAYFFEATQSVDRSLGDTHNFIWANYLALSEFYKKVHEHRVHNPSHTASKIESIFCSQTVIPVGGGIDFESTFFKSSWKDHEWKYAKWFLFDACSQFEEWLEKVCIEVFGKKNDLFNCLQFPAGTRFLKNSPGSPGKPADWKVALTAANLSHSRIICSEFYPSLKSNKLNRWNQLDDLLIAYRYFKTARNVIIHNGALSTSELINRYTDLSNLQSRGKKSFRHQFLIPQPLLNEKVPLEIKDCVLIGTIVRHLMATYDAALCVNAENSIVERIKSHIKNSGNTSFHMLGGDMKKRYKKLERLLSAAGIPKPANISNIEIWLKAKGIIGL